MPAYDPGAVWQRLLTDPVTGTALHLDHRRYRPPQRLAEFVRSREPTCTAPGCRVPAARCDLDHTIPFERGGETRADNLHPLCRRHHRAKTHTGWRCESLPDPGGGLVSVLRWTSPAGRTWLVRPPTLGAPAPSERRAARLVAA